MTESNLGLEMTTGYSVEYRLEEDESLQGNFAATAVVQAREAGSLDLANG